MHIEEQQRDDNFRPKSKIVLYFEVLLGTEVEIFGHQPIDDLSCCFFLETVKPKRRSFCYEIVVFFTKIQWVTNLDQPTTHLHI